MLRVVTATKVAERTKVCARCGERKPWSEYYPRTRWPDGTVRNVIAYCRPCAVVKAREWEQANPEKLRARWRKQSRARWQDPERASVRYAYERERHARKTGKPYVPRRRSTRSPIVDAAPFVAWLRTLGGTPEVMARVCGMHGKHVRVLLNGERRTVELDTVDRALLHADAWQDGLPVTLDTLYPLESEAA